VRKFGTPRFLPDKPFVQSLVIPAGSFLAGLIVYQIVRPVGLYVCIAAVFQRWTYSRLYKEERTRQMDQQDRELMNGWKTGEARRQMPPVIVEVAKGTRSVHSGAEESAFNERWQGVLNRPLPPPGQSPSTTPYKGGAVARGNFNTARCSPVLS
jgi:hypothetical protein